MALFGTCGRPDRVWSKSDRLGRTGRVWPAPRFCTRVLSQEESDDNDPDSE